MPSLVSCFAWLVANEMDSFAVFQTHKCSQLVVFLSRGQVQKGLEAESKRQEQDKWKKKTQITFFSKFWFSLYPLQIATFQYDLRSTSKHTKKRRSRNIRQETLARTFKRKKDQPTHFKNKTKTTTKGSQGEMFVNASFQDASFSDFWNKQEQYTSCPARLPFLQMNEII
jgi:hypothetical protein